MRDDARRPAFLYRRGLIEAVAEPADDADGVAEGAMPPYSQQTPPLAAAGSRRQKFRAFIS